MNLKDGKQGDRNNERGDDEVYLRDPFLGDKRGSFNGP
jgi:hypothetical protein